MKQQICLKKLGTKLCKKIIQEKKSLFRVMRQKEILTQLNVFKKKKKRNQHIRQTIKKQKTKMVLKSPNLT